MRKLSLTEFVDFCKEQKIKKFIYDTNRQYWYDKFKEFMLMDLYFAEIGVSLNPNILYFKNDSSVVRLNCVKCVYVTEEMETIGFVFSIVCGVDIDSKNNKKIVLVGYC